MYIWQIWHFWHRSHQFIHLNIKTTSENLLKIMGQLETDAIWSYPQFDFCWVDWTSCQLVIAFWLEPNYILLRTSHFFSLSSSFPIPHQHKMATQSPQPGESRSELSPLTGQASNAALAVTQQQHTHLLVHCDAANTAIKNVTYNIHFKMVRIARSSKRKKLFATGYEYVHVEVEECQLTVKHTAGIYGAIYDQFIDRSNRKRPLSTMAFVLSVCEMEIHNVVSPWIFTEEFCNKCPSEWTKNTSNCLEVPTEEYVVEVIVNSPF